MIARRSTILLVTALAFLTPAFAQRDKSRRSSPPGTAECQFADGRNVKIDYSRPSMRRRKIYGGLVPYGEEWRTGANEATTFVTNSDLDVGGTKVPAGNYTLFTLPTETQWTLIISKKTGEWGIPYPGKSEDLARIPMKSEKLPSPVEQFTIAFEKSGPGCTLHLDWETTRASIRINEQK